MLSTANTDVIKDESGIPDSTEDPTTQVQENGTEKTTHALENGEEPSSPRASKKRRLDDGPDALPNVQPDVPGESVDNQSDQELVAALREAVGQSNGIRSAEAASDSPAVAESSTNTAPDVAAMISDIMDHTERVEQHVAMGPQPMVDSNGQTTTGLVCLKANSHLKLQSLPILDNLSTQILSLLAKSSYQDITSLVSEPDSENGQAYATMRSLFDHTKRVYTTKSSFLSASDLGFTEPAQVDIIRKANLASFVSSIFGSQEISFAELNDHFLDVFVPEGGRLLKVQGALYLELKTQAFIASMNNGYRSRTELLCELFPEDLEQRVLGRRSMNRQLAPSEADFVKRAGSRREIILNDINNEEALKALPDKYHWEDFLRDLASYVSKNIDSISNQQAKKVAKARQSSVSGGESQDSPSAPLQSQFSVASQPTEVPVDKNIHGDLVARAARAAQIALQSQLRRSQQQAQQHAAQQQAARQQSQQQQQQQQQSQPPAPAPPTQPSQQSQPQLQQQPPQQTQHPVDPQQTQPGVPHGYSPAQPHGSHPTPQPAHQPTHQPPYQPSPTPSGYQQAPGQLTFQQSPYQVNFQQYHPGGAGPGPGRSNSQDGNHGYMPGIPHYSQSQPTQVLYERARMAASAKASPSSRKSGLPSQRRPWTTEEENALMAGLDRVKGPHWSQILAMFGPGGTISEALKDRNQVQLKDKARNLKLFFLKSGIEVPYYLKFVTGELKTRAPAQAAKREARERQQRQGEEDKAHVEGIKGMMALAGGHSQPGSVGHGPDSMSASPGVPDSNAQHLLDQAADQNLMQTLGQEVHGESFGQQQHHHQDVIDPSMQLGQ